MADYIDRQAALAALDKFVENNRGSGSAGAALAMATMAKSVILSLPSPWTDANGKPPEKTGEYLCAFKYNAPWDDVFIGRMTYCSAGKHKGFQAWQGQIVSHWMPLPDAPEVPEVTG